MLAAALILVRINVSSMQGDCKCRRPERDDKTRSGGNEAVVVVPKEHFREVKGIVTIVDEKVEGALVEVFGQPEYLVGDKPWNERPAQKRLRACVTSADGKFCFKELPPGVYELRISRDQGWDVTHVYVVVNRKAGSKKPLEVTMHLGT